MKNNNEAKHVFAHHMKYTIGSTVVLSKPKLENSYEKEMVLSAECVFPANKNIDLVEEILSNTITEDGKYSCILHCCFLLLLLH